MRKRNDAYKTISEVAQIVGLVNLKKGSTSTHTLRFWEREFKQIKPKIFSGNRRYYDAKQIKIIRFIKYLLKEKGMTIKGVKKKLNDQSGKFLDYTTKDSVGTLSPSKEKIKKRIEKISKIASELKRYKNG